VSSASPPKISVVIPSHNASDTLPSTIEALLRDQEQAGIPLEVVVVDDGSDDGTSGVIRSFEQLMFVRTEHMGPGGARNAGAEHATGDVLVFLDSDDQPLAGWVAQIAAAFDDVSVGFATWPAAVTDPRWNKTLTWFPDRHGPDGVLALAGCFGLRRSVFDDIGGYDPALRIGENSDLCQRAVARCNELGLSARRLTEVTIDITFGKPAAHYDLHRLEAMEYLLDRDAADLCRDRERRSTTHAIAAVNAARCEQWARARRHAWRSFTAQPLDVRAFSRVLGTCAPPLGRRLWSADERRRRVDES
jgi:glycosyltransferase involved in cell wall biosynthesis